MRSMRYLLGIVIEQSEEHYWIATLAVAVVAAVVVAGAVAAVIAVIAVIVVIAADGHPCRGAAPRPHGPTTPRPHGPTVHTWPMER